MLDVSGSVEENFSLIQDLTKTIVHGLNFNAGRTRVGLLTYQNQVQVRFHLNEYTSKSDVIHAISYDQRKAKGTHTTDALRTMRKDMFKARRGDRTAVDNVAIVITDGRSNMEQRSTIPEAELSKDDGIHMITVGVGRSVRHNEIIGMASNPASDNAYFLKDRSELDETSDLILDQLCDY